MNCKIALPFSLRGTPGSVSVAVRDDPAESPYEVLLGGRARDVVHGFPVCTAEIQYPKEGYAAVFGWTQMVKWSDGGSQEGFEIDPIALYRNLQTPYCWFGIKPTLFDAPWRVQLNDMTWVCQSYLCFTTSAVMSPHVRAIAGFRWGFDVFSGVVSIHEPSVLSENDWNDRLPLLRRAYPTWTFDAGFRDS